MTPAERKAAYQDSSLKQLMEASGHKICERCYCCDAFVERFPVAGSAAALRKYTTLDDWGPDPCSVCAGEGELWHTVLRWSVAMITVAMRNHLGSGQVPIPPGLPTESEG